MKYRFAVILTAFEAILLYLHWSVYEMIIRAVPGLALTNAILLYAILILFTTSFIVASFLAFKTWHWAIRTFYVLAAYWMGIFFYLFIAVILVDLVGIFSSTDAYVLSVITLISVLALSLYGFVNAKWIRVTRYQLALPHLPVAWTRKNIVLVSDIHLGAVNAWRYARRVVNKINELKPDIVFVPGDFFDGVACPQTELAEIFSQIKAPDGVYFVTGNHDGFFNSEKEIAVLRSSGMRVLENEVVEIDGVQVAGVNYRDTRRRREFVDILTDLDLDPNKPSILLKHVPAHVDESVKAGISLQLSGHTHEGQMFPAGIIARLAHNGFSYGLKKSGETQVVVSSGVGTWGPPMRVGTKAEIVRLELA